MTTDEAPGARWETNYREQMRRLREANGLSQTELARRLRSVGLPFHQQTIQKIEAGERPIRLNEAHLIADVLGADVVAMTASGPASAMELLAAVGRIEREVLSLVEATADGAADFFSRVEDFAYEFLRDDVEPLDGASLIWVGAWAHKVLRVSDLLTSFVTTGGRLMGESDPRLADASVVSDLRRWVEALPPAGPYGGSPGDTYITQLSWLHPTVLRDLWLRPERVSQRDFQGAPMGTSGIEWAIQTFRDRREADGEHREEA